MAEFGLFAAKHGSGWTGVHVTVAEWSNPSSTRDVPNLICLTAEAITPEELDGYIDELIVKVQDLKKTGRSQLPKMVAASG